MFARTKVNAGFTLIEVLVAFVILSIAVATLLVAFSGGVRNSALTRDYTKAVIIAESQLSQSGITQPFTGEETIEGMQGKFYWQESVSPLETDVIDEWQLFEVTVAVSWKTFNGQRSLQVSGLKWGKVDG